MHDRSVVEEYDTIALSELTPFHKNPRISNVKELAKSLHLQGQFQPIIVNRGTKTGRPYEILSGNHTYLGALRELKWFDDDGHEHHKFPWKTIDVAIVDVDDVEANGIVVRANALADNSKYHEPLLAELVASLPSREGTGISNQQYDNLMASIDEVLVDMDTDPKNIDIKSFDDEDDEDPDVVDTAPPVEEDEDDYYASSIERERDESDDIFDLKPFLPEGKKFYAPGYWQIPGLREDMLVQVDEIPDNLLAWAGSATKGNDDPDVWWLYNWGVDSTAGMQQDASQVITAFYTHDKYFDKWFYEPKKHTAKLLHSDIEMSINPNYSMWPDQSRFLNLYSLYRSRYVGRYMQEAGIKIIPDINWPLADLKFLQNHVLKTLPQNIPVIALQIQTFNEDDIELYGGGIEEAYQMVIDHIQPEAVLLYAGEPGHTFFTENVDFDGKLIYVENRLVALGKHRRSFEKRKGIK